LEYIIIVTLWRYLWGRHFYRNFARVLRCCVNYVLFETMRKITTVVLRQRYERRIRYETFETITPDNYNIFILCYRCKAITLILCIKLKPVTCRLVFENIRPMFKSTTLNQVQVNRTYHNDCYFSTHNHSLLFDDKLESSHLFYELPLKSPACIRKNI
jgi:hypothetical protein